MAASDKGISRFDGSSWTAHVYPDGFKMAKRRSGIRQSLDGSIWLNFIGEEERSPQMIVNQTEICRTVRHRAEKNPPDTEIKEYLERVSPPGNTHIAWAAHDPWSRTPAEQLQYSWRLNGGAWSAFSFDIGRTFLNLDPGDYLLEVRARDQAFNVDPTPAQVEFEVIPPVWKRGWFISLISTLLGLIVFFLYRWISLREQRLLEQQEQREAFLIRQREKQEAELRGELASLYESMLKQEELLKQNRKVFVPSEVPENEMDREFLDAVMAYLEERYSDWELRRSDLADAVNMSLSTFQRRLKAVCGQTPKELINEFRMARAAEFLVHTSYSVTDIAFRTGHEDSSNFARWFKKFYSVTPSQYRADNTPDP